MNSEAWEEVGAGQPPARPGPREASRNRADGDTALGMVPMVGVPFPGFADTLQGSRFHQCQLKLPSRRSWGVGGVAIVGRVPASAVMVGKVIKMIGAGRELTAIVKDREAQALGGSPSPSLPPPPCCAGDVFVRVPGPRDRAGCHLLCVHRPHLECDTSHYQPHRARRTRHERVGRSQDGAGGPTWLCHQPRGDPGKLGSATSTTERAAGLQTPDPLVFPHCWDLTLSN